MKRQDGFTLVELLAVIALISILLTLGVTALRYYWFGRALHGERDQVFTNLRALQQQVVSESNPVVFGAWFDVETPEDYEGTPQWGTVRLRPDLDPVTCTNTATEKMDAGVQFASASFSDSLTGVESLMELAEVCREQVPAAADATDFVFFLARGTATSGCVTLTQPRRDMADVTVAVSTLTGRVERISQDEVATRCPAI